MNLQELIDAAKKLPQADQYRLISELLDNDTVLDYNIEYNRYRADDFYN